MQTFKKVLAVIREYVLMTVGISMVACGVYFFEFLNHFTTGGISGLSLILAELFPMLNASTIMLVINVCLLLLAFILIGKSFGVKTVYCSLLLSLETVVMENLIAREAPLTDQPMLEVLLMVLLVAGGSALLFYLGACSGGTDIVAMIIKKFSSLNISKALFVADFLIVMLLIVVFDVKVWLFSILALLMRVLVVNYTLRSIIVSKYCTVITPVRHREALCKYITENLEKTATYSDHFTGAYQKNERSVLLVALTPRQAATLQKYARTLDEQIFIIMSDTTEVFGEGFEAPL